MSIPLTPALSSRVIFGGERQNPVLEVESIHQETVDSLDQTLEAVVGDRITRTILLTGDSGSGKSYLLGRLKRLLNPKACFAYIGPWPDSGYLWRHILRNTVDSLIQAPAGQKESQLLLWLKEFPSFKNRGFSRWMVRERTQFVRDLRASYPVGIYNPKEFFGVLYDLTNPQLRPLAYDWLRGDDLDEDDLKSLRVSQSIESEDAAQKNLANFGRIAASTQPIVLCFDNLDNIPILASGKPDLQALFSVNASIHNEKLDNFLILISIITSTWNQHYKSIQPADLARINDKLALKPINLDQATDLWAARLFPLHDAATPLPSSNIAPLSRDWLSHKFPGEKTLPRNVLMLGQQLLQQFKETGAIPAPPVDSPAPVLFSRTVDSLASFDLVWKKEFQKVSQQINRIGQLSSADLVWRLREALEALQIPQIIVPFLKGTRFAAYSLSHEYPTLTGIVWAEGRNLTTFYYLMKACQRVIDEERCDRLYLVRAETVGRSSNKGNQLYRQIFAYANYLHIESDLTSVHYLETYHNLVNAACGGELVVGQSTPDLKELQVLLRRSQVLNQCPLLQELELVADEDEADSADTDADLVEPDPAEAEPAEDAPLAANRLEAARIEAKHLEVGSGDSDPLNDVRADGDLEPARQSPPKRRDAKRGKPQPVSAKRANSAAIEESPNPATETRVSRHERPKLRKKKTGSVIHPSG